MTASKSSFDIRSRRIAVAAVLLGALLGALLTILTADYERQSLFDVWQRLSPRAITDENVVVVVIDEPSLSAYGAWPWPRNYLARLTEIIASERPRAIGMDIIFAESDARDPQLFVTLYPDLDEATATRLAQLPGMDEVFAQVIGVAPVVLARAGVERDGRDADQLMIETAIAGDPPAGALRLPQLLSSIEKLDDVALSHGLINGPPDADGIIRRVPLTIVADGQPMPGFAVELARIAVGEEQLFWNGRTLMLGSTALPADSSASLPLRFGEFPAEAVYSADEVLSGAVNGVFTEKIVLVGLTATGTADIVSTPQNTEIYGIYVQAQAIDAMLEEGWLSRPAWALWAEFAASLFLVLLILLAAAMRRYRLFYLALALALAMPAMSFLAFDRANLMLDPARPLIIAMFAGTAVWIAFFVIGRTEKMKLARQLVDQRVAAAEQEGELRAARRIQLGMVPDKEKLAVLDPRIEVGAVLEPAKSVGGDYYDALMIDENRLLFLVGDVTGKGVPAALFMALSKALSKISLRRTERDLGETVAALNRELMEEADDTLGLTMLVGVLDCETGEVSLVNAGHENPLVLDTAGTVESVPMKGGPPFCVIDFAYKAEFLSLERDQTLLLLSDGATEAQNEAQLLFEVSGVIDALRSSPGGSATDIASALARAVREFEGATEPSDDLTILAIRFIGQKRDLGSGPSV